MFNAERGAPEQGYWWPVKHRCGDLSGRCTTRRKPRSEIANYAEAISRVGPRLRCARWSGASTLANVARRTASRATNTCARRSGRKTARVGRLRYCRSRSATLGFQPRSNDAMSRQAARPRRRTPGARSLGYCRAGRSRQKFRRCRRDLRPQSPLAMQLRAMKHHL